MSKIIQLPRKRRGADTDKVQVRVNPYLAKGKRGFRCDDVRSRMMRVSGRSRHATVGVHDEDLLDEEGVVVRCKSPEHAVNLVNAIGTSITEGEVQAVLEGREFPLWPQEVVPAKNVRKFGRR